MAHVKRWCWILWGIAFASVPSGVVQASHCEYCNAGLPSEVVIASSEIGVDGVIVVRLVDARERIPETSWWDIVTVTVTDIDGAVVDGALEVNPGFSPAAWRPEDTWVPGVYEVAVYVDLQAFPEPEFEPCSAFARFAEVVVVDGSRHVFGQQSLSVTENYSMSVSRKLSSIVCWDGALPRSSTSSIS